MAYFDLGPGRPGRLLMVIYHLAVDGVSWRILLEDLQAVYQQLQLDAASGVVRDPVGAVHEPTLPSKTTSFRAWALRLAEYARSDAVRAELDYWLAASGGRVARLPVDYQGGANTEGSARGVTVELSAEETRALLQDVPAAYHTEINDVLMTALAQACAGWTGTRAVLIELEGHGREDLFEDIDISRTVGWFTTVFPVRLDLPDRGGPGESLKAVKEQLRRMPNRGIGYGLLRYLADDATGERLRALPPAEISFNYLGQTAQALQEGTSFVPASEDGGPSYSPLATRSCLLDINGAIVGGQLQMHWTYSENIHRRATVERVAQEFIAALRALIAHCQSPNAGGYTPSDFSLAKLDQRKLDKVLAKFNKKERSAR